MTSSSNIAGDFKQGLRLRKVNARYFSFKWKTDSGESTLEKNSTKYKSNGCTSDNSNDENNTNGFFKSIKKKLSIKNLYKSKRKIIATESSNGLEEGSSSLVTDSNERPCSFTSERHRVEIRDRISASDPEVTAADSSDPIQFSRNKINQCPSSNYLNFQTNANTDRATGENHENADLIINRSNENITEPSRSISKAEAHVNSNRETSSCSAERLESTEESQAMSSKTESDKQDSPTEGVSQSQNTMKESQCSLSQELVKLSKYGWYWGSISGDEADAKLISEPDGAFLIRDSSDHRYLLTLSFKSAGRLLHARVEHSGGMFSLCNQGESGRFSSVPALIDHSMNSSRSAVFCYSRPRYPGYPAFPVRLTKPISRFSQVRSLQYLCRFVIRQHMRRDNICKLPLPESIKGYVEEGPYY